MFFLPPPLWGRAGVGGGTAVAAASYNATPHPNPPPQGGGNDQPGDSQDGHGVACRKHHERRRASIPPRVLARPGPFRGGFSCMETSTHAAPFLNRVLDPLATSLNSEA